GIDVEIIDVGGLSVEDWGKIGDVAIGKDVGMCDEDVKVVVSEFSDVVDIGVVGIDGEMGTIGMFGDISDVVIGVFDVDVDKMIVGIVKVNVDVLKVGIDVDVGGDIEVNVIGVIIWG
ncbi:hypothetical protein KI387_030509, partial [Taxus chinensis]